MENSKLWWQARNGERQGPFTADELKQRGQQGLIGAEDLIWKSGMQSWVSATSIKGLVAAVEPPPLPPSAVQPPPLPAIEVPRTAEAPVERVARPVIAVEAEHDNGVDWLRVEKFNKLLIGIWITAVLLFAVVPNLLGFAPPLLVSLLMLAALAFTLNKLTSAMGKNRSSVILYTVLGIVPLAGFIASIVVNLQASKLVKQARSR